MDLKEAREILTNIIDDEVIGTYCIEIQKEGVPCDINCEDKDCYLHTAIETILQELDNLQKENEEYKSRNEILESCKYIDSIEIIRAKLEECERWRSKIREKIEEVNQSWFDFLGQRDVDKTIQILQDLLKEE